MSSKILSPRVYPALQPAHLFWKLYAPDEAPYRFRARSLSEARRWQKKTRAALAELLAFPGLPPAPLAPKKIEKVDRGDHWREKVLLQTSRHTLMPVYLLTPKKEDKPWPVVLALHGHGYGAKEIVGLDEKGAERNSGTTYQKDFALALCRRGFAVAVPDISCFGERETDFSFAPVTGKPGHPPRESSCYHAAKWAFHLGGSVVGLRTHDNRRLVDYLSTRREFDLNRLGAMGISGGGMSTLYSTCLDERIRACVISGYFSSFRDSILNMHHCFCNFVPQMHRFGEMTDLIALVAPRPVLLEAGEDDPIFPFAAVKKAAREARQIYRRFGKEKNVQTDYFKGDHQIHGTRAYDFLATTLRA
jgi:dienelactone hydrolase